MDLFEQLTVLPTTLSRVQESLSPALWRVRSGPFAFVEHCWHLADLERLGFGSRVERLLAEERPFLPDFDGEKVAAERQYLVLSRRRRHPCLCRRARTQPRHAPCHDARAVGAKRDAGARRPRDDRRSAAPHARARSRACKRDRRPSGGSRARSPVHCRAAKRRPGIVAGGLIGQSVPSAGDGTSFTVGRDISNVRSRSAHACAGAARATPTRGPPGLDRPSKVCGRQ